jgi:hypothetical protein
MGLIPILLLATPAAAITAKEKMETCKFGADHQQLTGAKRKTFISRCMGNTAFKRVPARKPVAQQPAASPAPAPRQ